MNDCFSFVHQKALKVINKKASAIGSHIYYEFGIGFAACIIYAFSKPAAFIAVGSGSGVNLLHLNKVLKDIKAELVPFQHELIKGVVVCKNHYLNDEDASEKAAEFLKKQLPQLDINLIL
jgi:hypothetical protein